MTTIAALDREIHQVIAKCAAINKRWPPRRATADELRKAIEAVKTPVEKLTDALARATAAIKKHISDSSRLAKRASAGQPDFAKLSEVPAGRARADALVASAYIPKYRR